VGDLVDLPEDIGGTQLLEVVVEIIRAIT